MALRRRGGGDDEMGDVSVHPNATDGPAPLGLQRPGFGESTTLAPPNSAPSLEDVLEGGACAREGDTWHGGSGGSRSLVGPTDCPADCDLPDYAGAGLAEVPISEITRALQPSVSVGNLSAKGPAARPPPGVQDLRVDRQTACGNPFPMGADGRDERLRDAVCFAFDEFLKDPIGADLDAIAAKYQLRVDGRFRKPAARQGLADALDAAEARLRAGESLRLMCWCFPKRCHADGIARTLRLRLRDAGCSSETVVNVADDTRRAAPAIFEQADTARMERLTLAHLVSFAALTSQGVVLLFITALIEPLIFAHVNGYQVLGAELPLSSARSMPMRLLERWAELAFTTEAAATTFMIGQYGENGPRLGVCLLPFVPVAAAVVRSSSRRRHLCSMGSTLMWCTLVSLMGTPLYDPAARALASVAACVGPVTHTADLMHEEERTHPVFRLGAAPMASMVGLRAVTYAYSTVGYWLQRDAGHQQLLRDALLASDDPLLEGWAERIRPPPQELLDLVQVRLPDMLAVDLLALPFTPVYAPAVTAYLPRMPAQLLAVPPHCVRSAMELLTPQARVRVHTWLGKALAQLHCIELKQLNCELLRPQAIALGQAAMLPWARGRIWDLTFERSACAVPLDVTLPNESNLDLAFLRRRLEGYPDQNLVANILDGIRFEADVELQTILVPHLISLPKGFESVRKELYRLSEPGWYKFFEDLPFWPIYLNGQGATSRKLEERYRRTTECGGPRKPTFDEEGLQALSLNVASRIRHLPVWFTLRHDPPWLRYLHERGLANPAQLSSPSLRPQEIKPNLGMIMNDLSILLATARHLDEPLYVFGDDAKDYFNQLAIASEDWWKLGIVFLHADEIHNPRPVGERLFFVSERRLGFGASPSSNIAQRFSEAILSMMREDMDLAEQRAPPDERPKAVAWREIRTRIRSADLQTRLYVVHMYTDDPIFGVVGRDRALRLLSTWMRLVTEMRLKMAIHEKRHLGTWAPWLGVLLLAGLGLVLIPKAKLLRTIERINELLTHGLSFQDYRALIGMLEHLRYVYHTRTSCMYGLYEPHGSRRVLQGGPNTLIRPTPFQCEQLLRHRELLVTSGGAPMTAAIRRQAEPINLGLAVIFTVTADAATDSVPPGLGGFCHGLWWHVEIPMEWLPYLHITVLELCATCVGAIVFAPYLAHARRVRLQSDALATPFVLSRHRAHSPMLSLAHHLFLRNKRYNDVAAVADVQHIGGDTNVFGDAVSRNLLERFRLLCRAANIRPLQIQVPEAALDILHTLARTARAIGVRLRPQRYVRRDPVIPAAMLGLGRHSTANEDGDAVATLSAKLQARMGHAPARAGQRPTGPLLSHRLASALGGANAAAPIRVGPAALPPQPAISQRLAEKLQQPAALAVGAGKPPLPRAMKRPPMKQPPAAALEPKQSRASSVAVRARPQAVRRGELTLTTIGKLRLMALPRAPVRTSAAADALHAASTAQSNRRAASFASLGFGANHSVGQLAALLQHASDLTDFGTAHGTRRKDEAAWSHWEQFAELVGFDPLLSAQQVRDHPGEVGTLMATFLLFIYPKMKGRSSRQWAKPRSAFAYVLALIRIFRKWKILLPAAKVVQGELNGLLRAFVSVHGAHSLMPHRREPMKFSMVQALVQLGAARLGTTNYDPNTYAGWAFRGMLSLGWRTGHRLAEFVAHPSGEICYVTRHDVTYIIAGVHVSDPTPAQLAALRPGDTILIAPPRSKTDQFGEIHSPFPSAISYSSDPNSAGFIIQQIEIDRPARGLVRETTPLFANEHGQPYTHAFMDSLLHVALVKLYGEKVAACYSWHSLRSGLATALKAAGASDDVIQMICRWASPESLKIYARHGTSLHINWVNQAEKAIVDSIQVANIPKICNSEGNIALMHAYGGTIPARARHVLDNMDVTAEDAAETPPPSDSSPLTSANAMGRRVRVPAVCWPTYPCLEHNGHGWTACIIALNRGDAATVRFSEAADARGLPFADVQLNLAILIPF